MQLDKFEIFPCQEDALWCAYSLKLKSYCKSSLQHSESNENSINWSKKKKKLRQMAEIIVMSPMNGTMELCWFHNDE